MRPTAMLFRNLAAMDVEEAIRAHPLDGVVLLMGCDKTTPALLMGAASRRPADHRRLRRAAAARRLSRPDHRLRHQHHLHERAAARRRDHAARNSTRPKAAMNRSRRPLHDDGHRLDHGLAWSRRSASACPRTPPSRPSDARRNAAGPHGRAAHRRDGERGSRAVEDPDPRGVRERDPHARPRSAAPPTPSCTCSPSPAGSASS